MNKAIIFFMGLLVIGAAYLVFNGAEPVQPRGVISNGAISDVNQDQMLELLEQGDSVLIDIRSDQEFESGAIPQAHHLPIDNLIDNPDALEKFGAKKLIFYCHSGGRVKRLARHLTEIKHPASRRFHHLSGDFSAWRDSGKPVSQ